ncbi:hypothetical protein [Hydrogenophaga sp. 2FB]|uniref:hypothetical protein n=1 Tax=Hydrogenophaga sp. 2FB TaxID=2502187 RepID=UPI0010F9A89B|nr:hypothetical protein [Hydrogenophaga sp. 2FB]
MQTINSTVSETHQPAMGTAHTSEDPMSGLFDNRIPSAAARQTATVLAWLTECQLATLESLQMRKSTPKSELRRQQSICDDAVSQCQDLGIGPGVRGLRGHGCPRLSALLASKASKISREPNLAALCSTGIHLAYNYRQEWSAKVEYATWHHGASMRYEGQVCTSYADKDLSAVIDHMLKVADSIGVSFPRGNGIEPHIYVEMDGEDSDVPLPEDWVTLVAEQCKRLGWSTCYIG